MHSGESFLQHFLLSDHLTTQSQLRSDLVDSTVVLSDGLKVLEPHVLLVGAKLHFDEHSAHSGSPTIL